MQTFRTGHRLVSLFAVIALLIAIASPAAAIEWPWGKKVPKNGQQGSNINVISPTTGNAYPLPGEQGRLYVQSVDPPTQPVFKYTQIINNRLVVGNRDTSAAYPTCGANHIIIYLTITPDSATCSTVWALGWRRHHDTYTDSLSMYRVRPLTSRPGTANSSGNTAFTLNAATDTVGTAVPQNTFPTTLALWPGEMLFAAPNNLHDPRLTYSFELMEGDHSFVSSFTSFYVRPLAVNGTTACSARASASCTIRVDMEGLR